VRDWITGRQTDLTVKGGFRSWKIGQKATFSTEEIMSAQQLNSAPKMWDFQPCFVFVEENFTTS